jgi:hypothetical protein
MIKVFEGTKVSINPDDMIASDIYTGVIIQGETVKADDETLEEWSKFRNKNCVIDELVECNITDKIIVTYGGDVDRVTSEFSPDSIILTTDYVDITEKRADEIKIGDNLVDANFYDIFHKKDFDLELTAVFIENVEHIKGEFKGYEIYLSESDSKWYGIYTDNLFTKNLI